MTTAVAALLMTVCAMAQTSSDRSSMEQALRSYFQNYGNGYSGFPVTASLSSIDVDANSRIVKIAATERFGEQEFTPDIVKGIYSRIRSIIPKAYHNYDLRLYTQGKLIDDLVPNRLRDHKDRSRQWGHIDYKGKPWVTRASRPNDISHGLDGRHLTAYVDASGYITVQNAQGLNITAFNSLGNVVRTTKGIGMLQKVYTGAKGMYVVKIGNRAWTMNIK